MATAVNYGYDGYEVRENPINHQVWKLSRKSHATFAIDYREDLGLSGNESEASINTTDELGT